MGAKLDRQQHYATCHGSDLGICFQQNGKSFDAAGDEIDEAVIVEMVEQKQADEAAATAQTILDAGAVAKQAAEAKAQKALKARNTAAEKKAKGKAAKK